MTPLLAKSCKPGRREVTLLSHTQDVLAAADTLFGVAEPTALGTAWLRFFRLTAADFPKFRAGLLAAVLLHDAGKLNSDFQKAVRQKHQQVIRHEAVSGLLMTLPGVWEWLAKGRPDVDWDVALIAVLTHHIKFEQERFGNPATALTFITVDYHSAEFATFVASVGDHLAIPGAPAFPKERVWTFDPAAPGQLEVMGMAEAVTKRFAKLKRAIKGDESRARLLRAVRTGLIVADAAGSGLTREGLDIPAWIRNCFPAAAITPEELEADIIKKRLDQLREIGKWKDNGNGGWNTFQTNCDHYPARTLLLAPCGSGKTLAAWRWIKAQLAARPARRVIFLYPTRATATEGFKDYVSWAPESDAGLMHGTAEYDLTDMFANEPGDRKNRDYQADRALYALGFWAKKYFSATVDQFFAFLHHQYGPTCMLPALADAVLVVDECHSFDEKMFDSLVKFLREFDVPTLCMTATLPEPRIKDLAAAGLHIPDDVMTPELAKVAGAPRYAIGRATKEDAFDKALTALNAGKRVLWVANRVAEAQEIAGWFRGHAGRPAAAPVICYHSRFTLDDRGRQHQKVVTLFRSAKPGEVAPPALAVSTQVCEMSLDMDADVVISERCPITALIQRMGRCNRVMEPRAESGDVWVYGTGKDKPYDADDLVGVEEFLAAVTTHRVSQIELEAALRKHGPTKPDDDRTCLFLCDPLNANSKDDEAALRDIEQFSKPCVLDADVAAYVKAAPEKKPGFVVPVPKKFADYPEPAPKNWPPYLGTAPAANYDRDLGFRDQPIEE